MSPLLQSTPKSYCKKSPSQLNNDRERYVKPLRDEKDHKNNSPSKRNKTAFMNQISKDNSALHSLSLLDTASPTSREIAQHKRKQAKRPNNKVLLKTVVKKDQQERGEQQLFAPTLSKGVRERDETRLKIQNQCTNLSNSPGDQETTILSQHSSNTADKREQKTLERSLRARPSANETSSVNTKAKPTKVEV